MAKKADRFTQALETVKGVLERAGLKPLPLEQGGGFEANFSQDGPDVRALARVLDKDKFLFYFEFSKKVKSAMRPATAEYVTRANYGLTVGNFELDFETGLVRYKSSLDFSGQDLPALLVRNIILSGIYCMETYADGLTAVMDGKKDPEEAIALAEETL